MVSTCGDENRGLHVLVGGGGGSNLLDGPTWGGGKGVPMWTLNRSMMMGIQGKYWYIISNQEKRVWMRYSS